jgi:hypothetical protein
MLPLQGAKTSLSPYLGHRAPKSSAPRERVQPVKCPTCTKETAQEDGPEGELRIWCPACGWGADEPIQTVEQPNIALWKLAILWVAALAIAFCPYIFLHVSFGRGSGNSLGFGAVLLAHYWWMMPIYLLCARFFLPTYDPNVVLTPGSIFDRRTT